MCLGSAILKSKFAYNRHRHAADHQCPSLQVDEKEERRMAAQEKLSKTFSPPATKRVSTSTIATRKPTKRTGGMVELMKIKSKAKVKAIYENLS